MWPHAVALVDVVIYSWAEAPQSATKTQKHNPISQGSIKKKEKKRKVGRLFLGLFFCPLFSFSFFLEAP